MQIFSIFKSKKIILVLINLITFLILIELTLQSMYYSVNADYGFLIPKVLTGAQNLFFGNVAGKQFNPFLEMGWSIIRSISAIALSIVFGIFFSIFIVGSHFLQGGIERYFNFVRSIPITFMVPFVYVIPDASKSSFTTVIIATIPCSLILAISIAEYCKSIHPDIIWTAKKYFSTEQSYWNFLQYFIHFYKEKVISGFKIGLSTIIPYAVILVGVIEYFSIGGGSGLGYLVFQVNSNNNLEDSFSLVAAICLYGFFGFIMLQFSSWLHKRA